MTLQGGMLRCREGILCRQREGLQFLTRLKLGCFPGIPRRGSPRRDWRRSLGKWLKAAMLLRIREELPQVRVVATGNATSNAAMLSINVRLGFKPHREGIGVQMSLDELEAYLRSRGVELGAS